MRMSAKRYHHSSERTKILDVDSRFVLYFMYMNAMHGSWPLLEKDCESA